MKPYKSKKIELIPNHAGGEMSQNPLQRVFASAIAVLLLFLIAVMDTAGVDVRHRSQNVLESFADDAARYETGQGSLTAV